MIEFRRLVLAAAMSFSAAASGVSAVDDRGHAVTLDRPAARIVSLAPYATELVFAAGAGGRLVGVTAFSDYPPAARKLPSLGDAGKVDVERIVGLKPDLVIGWQSGNHAGDLALLERLGFKVLVTEPRHLGDIPRLLREIGKLAGSTAEADRAALDFERQSADLQRRYAARRPVRVFYQIWDSPLMTVNGQHLINEVIALCGGQNVFAQVPVLTPTVSLEGVLAADPQAIVASGGSSAEGGGWQAWQRFPGLSAVKSGRLFFIHPDLIQRQTPRILQGARQLCEDLELAR